MPFLNSYILPVQARVDGTSVGFSPDVVYLWSWNVEGIPLATEAANGAVTEQYLEILPQGLAKAGQEFQISLTMTNTTTGGSSVASLQISVDLPPSCDPQNSFGCLQVRLADATCVDWAPMLRRVLCSMCSLPPPPPSRIAPCSVHRCFPRKVGRLVRPPSALRLADGSRMGGLMRIRRCGTNLATAPIPVVLVTESGFLATRPRLRLSSQLFRRASRTMGSPRR